jgi:nucleoside-diphosphate-sugar epimerase
MTKRILIAGCGKLGSTVAVELASLGHQVTGLRRSVQMTKQDVNYLQADLTCPESLAKLPTEFDLVLMIVTPSDYSEAGYRAIYVEGVGNLLSHFAGRDSFPHVIYVSSTRVYGQQRGERIDEGSETIPADAQGRILLEAEQQVLAFGEANATKINTVVRFSGIYGAGSQFMQRIASQGKPAQFAPPCFTNRVHREDCVGSLVFLAEKALSGEALESHYLVSDNDPAPKWEVVNWVAEQTGLPSPEKEICDASAGQGKRCSNQRIREAGYSFKYPSYREGYKV